MNKALFLSIIHPFNIILKNITKWRWLETNAPARGLQCKYGRSLAIAAAAVRMRHTDGRTIDEASVGDGPVEASFKALERATGIKLGLKNFEVRSVTMGEDAQGEVTVTVDYNGLSHRGHGVSTDIVEAGALAYLDVINRVCRQAAGRSALAATAAGVGTSTAGDKVVRL